MRAEYAAALTNFLLILLIAVGAMTTSSSSNQAHVYSDPVKAAITAVLMGALVATPLAVIAFWRTWVHAERSSCRGSWHASSIPGRGVSRRHSCWASRTSELMDCLGWQWESS